MWVQVGAGGGRIAVVAAVSVLFACAPKQRIPLDACVTEEVVVFVDGRLLEDAQGFVELRSDQPHKLYFKRPGEPPHLVVLEADPDEEGRPRLLPADPCRELLAVGLDRELTIEIDEDSAAPPRPAQGP
jgi:hypothetical protein